MIKNPRRITDGDFCNFISKYVILVSSELSRRSGAGFHAAHHECFPGDALTSQCVPLPDETDATAPDGFPQAPHGLLHVIRRTDSGDDVCRAVTRWTQKVRLP